jgi:dihydroxyacetone kinase
VATAARAVLSAADRLPLAEPGHLCRAIGDILATSMGGSSGVIGSIFFAATGESLEGGADWPEALAAGLERIRYYGGAAPGDRTLVDALAPAIDSLPQGGLAAAAEAAERGAKATAGMARARAGRSAYVGASALEGVVDPGALAIARAFRAAQAATEGNPR